MTTELGETELLDTVAACGLERPTAHQLKRWRRAGLVPRPRVLHTTGKRGSHALYPPWAVDQLAAVARLHSSVHGLDDLIVAMWWEGQWAAPDALRVALCAPLEKLSQEARGARNDAGDPYDAADRLLAKMNDGGRPSALVSLMRSRLSGRADYHDVLWTLLVLGLGGAAPWEEEDQSQPDSSPGALALLEKAMGVEHDGRATPVGTAAWPPADIDLGGVVTRLRDAGGFDLDDMAQPIRDASTEQLAQAREDARLFAGPLALIGSVIKDLTGANLAGLASLSTFDPASTSSRAGLVRSMLILRPLVGDGAFVVIADLVKREHARYVAIAELRGALPQHADFLKADFAAQLAALPPEHAELVRAEVRAVLDARPLLGAALSGSPGLERGTSQTHQNGR
jgi:hypothetical protein